MPLAAGSPWQQASGSAAGLSAHRVYWLAVAVALPCRITCTAFAAGTTRQQAQEGLGGLKILGLVGHTPAPGSHALGACLAGSAPLVGW